MSRRRAIRLLGGAALATIPALKLAGEASAGRSWCRYDPLFEIGGYLFDVSVAADEAMLAAATGPVQITLRIPRNMDAVLVRDDVGFGYGYTYKIIADRRQNSTKSFSVGVEMVCPASDSTIPVSVRLVSMDKTATVPTSTEVFGLANETVTWFGKVAKVDQTGAEEQIVSAASA